MHVIDCGPVVVRYVWYVDISRAVLLERQYRARRQLVSQFARLAGARVIVLDYNAKRLELAKNQRRGNGCAFWEAAICRKRCSDVTHGKGCDSVMIAAATQFERALSDSG